MTPSKMFTLEFNPAGYFKADPDSIGSSLEELQAMIEHKVERERVTTIQQNLYGAYQQLRDSKPAGWC